MKLQDLAGLDPTTQPPVLAAPLGAVIALSWKLFGPPEGPKPFTISDSTYQADDLLAAEWKFLYKIKLSHEHLKCAAEIIEDYSKSQDEHIQTSAEGAAWVYRALITLESELLRHPQRVRLTGGRRQPPLHHRSPGDNARDESR